MCKDKPTSISPFIFVEEDSCLQSETRDKPPVKPPGCQAPKEEFFSISVEQILVMLAIEAAPSRWRFRKVREKELEKVMAVAEQYICLFSHPGNPGCGRELTAYRKFLQRVLRLGTDNIK